MKLKKDMERDYAKALENNSDFYGSGIYRFAERWAEMMEERLATGKSIADIAGQTSHDSDTEGITGVMYGCAVGVLAHFWEHGEELRRWHNLDTQVGEEGIEANKKRTVLNPALLNIR